MKAQTFNAIASATKMEARTIDMARDRLVHGMKLQEVAAKHGVTHQLVWAAERRILTHAAEDAGDILRRKLEHEIDLAAACRDCDEELEHLCAKINAKLRKRLMAKLAEAFAS
jgi:hypothetical protein